MRYRADLPQAKDNQSLRVLLQRMLGELQRSHFAILPKEMAVFTQQQRSAQGEIGVELAGLGRTVVVSRVENDSPAARAGVRPGDVLVAIDKVQLATVAQTLKEAKIDESLQAQFLKNFAIVRLQAVPGATRELVVQRGTAPAKTISVMAERYAGTWSEPIGYFPSMPIRSEVLRGTDGIAYWRFNVFAPGVMKEFRALRQSLQPDDGLILDLRGNPGGLMIMTSGISGWLFDREVVIGRLQSRRERSDLTVSPQEGAFLGPLAVLIDGASASASEPSTARSKTTNCDRIPVGTSRVGPVSDLDGTP